PLVSLFRSAPAFFLHSLLFFLMLPLPPISTLFPYTTLFRSCRCCSTAVRRARGPPASGCCPEPCAGCPSTSSDRRCSGTAWSRRDRKSTRLNSSHVSISYAVFCLKKKKKTNKENND